MTLIEEIRRTQPSTLNEVIEIVQSYPIVRDVVNSCIISLTEKGHPITLFLQGAALAVLAMRAEQAEPEIEWLEELAEL